MSLTREIDISYTISRYLFTSVMASALELYLYKYTNTKIILLTNIVVPTKNLCDEQDLDPMVIAPLQNGLDLIRPDKSVLHLDPIIDQDLSWQCLHRDVARGVYLV